jgi:hypothetical protein
MPEITDEADATARRRSKPPPRSQRRPATYATQVHGWVCFPLGFGLVGCLLLLTWLLTARLAGPMLAGGARIGARSGPGGAEWLRIFMSTARSTNCEM